ncbi:MAG: penicillin-binding protein 2, partial [Oscillospiraceae bacterium]|nr:penicillin-binding protein 2 [Oscillospiraceae bacterium]
FIVIMGALLLRVAKIGAGEISKESAALQSRKVLELSKTRAGIFDRNMIPFVNKNQKRRIVVFPDILEVPAINGFFDRDSLAEIFMKKEPSVLDIGGKIIEGKGIYNFSFPERYSEETSAPHIVGYISGGKGVFGAEKSFDEFLSENGKSLSVSYYTDGTGRLLSGEEIVLDSEEVFEKSGVVLTLDSKIQKITEKALSEGTEKGAAVVMDIKNGEILASASVPDFEPEKVPEYLNSENSPFVNRAFSAYSVGSTWKILVAAAALESGISPEKTFECNGKTEVDGRIYKCHWETGHGEINMEKALEISCNPYFINLAIETGGEKILETAKNLGFGNPSCFGENWFSASGNLPSEEELFSKTVLASFAFGQGKLLATPVQLAVLASAIGNGGYAVTPKIVLGTFDRNGIWEGTPDYSKNRVMSIKTAETVKKMMINVVENGSGKNAKPEKGSAGGKTASAQTGQFDKNGNEIIHAWFIGFYPAENPEYAVAVLAEGMDSGGDHAAPIFKKICDGIEMLNYN